MSRAKMTDEERRARQRAHYRENAERVKTRTAAYRKANPERIKAADAAYRKANLERIKARKVANAKALLIAGARCRARRRGLEFDLTVEGLYWPTHCPIFGVELVYGGAAGCVPECASLDRVDNTRGYVLGNVEVISLRANSIKRDATPEELRKLADYYEREAAERAWLEI